MYLSTLTYVMCADMSAICAHRRMYAKLTVGVIHKTIHALQGLMAILTWTCWFLLWLRDANLILH